MEALAEHERMQFLIQHITGGNKRKFAQTVGIDQAVIGKLCQQNCRLHLSSYIDRIAEAYPAVNKDWLLTGIGYSGDISASVMKQRYVGMIGDRDRTIARLTAEIERQGKVIDRLLKG